MNYSITTPEDRVRTIGRLEGSSLLLLLLIAMPVKYLFGDPILVKVVGMAHGILFLAYAAVAAEASTRQNWPRMKLILCLILSCIPGGTFFFESKYLLEQKE